MEIKSLGNARYAGIALILALVSACSPAATPVGIEDQFEAQNRAVHLGNRDLDRFIVRPTANAYGTILPAPVRTGVGNFASNLNMPGTVLNNLLQLRLEDAATNTLRFVFNSTLGLAGLRDVATDIGLPQKSTDFGETLYVWGVGEGSYAELPLVGPSTSRHAVGRVVDTAINPLNFLIVNPERTVATASGIAARFGDRYRLSDFIDSVLYESEDSYAQARLLYLQNRRFQLTGESGAVEDFDPYEDVYGTQ